MKHNPRRRKDAHDFWWAWREEWERLRGQSPDEPPAPPPPGPPPPGPPDRLAAWREFFQRFTGATPENHWAFGGRRFHPWHQGDVTFNPFVANLFSQGGGLLPLVVLNMLAEKPRYASELMTLISEKTSGQWVANPGAMYPLMTELENRGLVQGEWEDPRKRTVRIYHITGFGRRELARVKAILRPRLEEAIEVLQNLIHDFNDNHEDEKGEFNV